MTVTLESLKKSVGKKNSKSEIFAWLADLERAAGDLDGALQRVNGGLTLYPHDVAAMIVRAKILFQQENYDECVAQCESILVKDPFSLAGQKIMGDAFDKLGKVYERNLCYRRYHDKDPLNGFWKDEYDVADMIPDVSDSISGAALSEADFSMPEMSMPDMNMPEMGMPEVGMAESFMPQGTKTLEELEAENAMAMGSDALELSSGDLFKDDENSSTESSFEKAFGDTFGSLAEEDTESLDGIGGINGSAGNIEEEGGIFEKSSASTMGVSLEDEELSGTSSPFSSFGSDEPAEDDPFAALASMLPNGDAEEDTMMDNLFEALNSTMAEISENSSEEKTLEEFPVDDNISGTDVNSAMSSFFGLEDDLEPEETADAGSTFDGVYNEVDERAAANASSLFGSSNKDYDKPMSVDNAFNDIFGEDELPEELPQKPSVPVASDDFTFVDEKPAAEAPKNNDEPQTVDNAFNDIFGEDELPEERPQPVESSFEKSSEGGLELPAESGTFELPAEEGSLELSGAAESFDLSAVEEETSFVAEVENPEAPVLSSAMDFIEDDTPASLELPTGESAQDVSESIDFETAGEATLDISGEAFLEMPTGTTPLDLPSEEGLFEKSAEEASLENFTESSVQEQPVETSTPENDAEDSFGVGNAFSSIFGSDDDLPEESAPVDAAPANLELPAEEPAPEVSESIEFETAGEVSLDISGEASLGTFTETTPLDLPAEEGLFEKSAEEGSLENLTESSVQELPVETSTPENDAEDSFGVGNAFSSIFGSDDDLPEESSPVNAAPASLELPAEEPAQEVSESIEFETAGDAALDISGEASLGIPTEMSTLDLPAEEGLFEKSAEEGSLENLTESSVQELPVETSTPENDAEDSFGVGNAFSSIFGSDDDLPEEKPQVEEQSPAVEVHEETLAAPAEASVEPAANNNFSVDSAFDSLFGSDDDMPEETPRETPAAEPIVEDNRTLAEQVDQAEAELELPSASKSESSDLAQEMGGAFASMFGDQEDLDLPELSSTTPVADNVTDADNVTETAGLSNVEEASSDKLESDFDKSFSALFGSDESLNQDENQSGSLFSALDSVENAPAENQENAPKAPAMTGVDSLESEVSGAFKGLFDMDDDTLPYGEDKPSNSGVDFLMSGDSDDEVSAGLINNPDAPLDRGAQNIDESLNTKTLAEIYFEQGLYGKALEIYGDLAQKEPDNGEIAKRHAEVKKIYRDKFGGNK